MQYVPESILGTQDRDRKANCTGTPKSLSQWERGRFEREGMCRHDQVVLPRELRFGYTLTLMSPEQETERPLQQRAFPPETLDRLRREGFEIATISSNPEIVRVMKGGCALLLERKPNQSLVLHQKPGYLIKGEVARLWDAGYQKFWLLTPASGDPFTETRQPALATHLKALYDFEEAIKHTLGIPSFYNEAIGSTNKVTAYDRVHGRDASSGQYREPF